MNLVPAIIKIAATSKRKPKSIGFISPVGGNTFGGVGVDSGATGVSIGVIVLTTVTVCTGVTTVVGTNNVVGVLVSVITVVLTSVAVDSGTEKVGVLILMGVAVFKVLVGVKVAIRVLVGTGGVRIGEFVGVGVNVYVRVGVDVDVRIGVLVAVLV